MIALASDFLGRFCIEQETGRSKTFLSRPLISFQPKAAAELGPDCATHLEREALTRPVPLAKSGASLYRSGSLSKR